MRTAEPCAPWHAGRYAAIDIGTVTCRMLVADVDATGAITEVDREYSIVNLGEGVDASGVLKPAAMERTAAAVARYCAVRDELSLPEQQGVPTVAVATSAARDAANANDFAALLSRAGVQLSVIPGQREAALSFSGASSDFPGERLAVVDVGGGSTEVVAGRAGGAPDHARSFDIGCRRVTERFFAADPPAAGELARARGWVADTMRPYFAELAAVGGFDRIVAVAGTATSVVAVRERMETYDQSRVHGATVSRADLDAVFAQLASVPTAQRAQTMGLDPGRAPVIVAGLVILQTVLDLAGADSFTVSESDILHGIVLDAARGGFSPASTNAV